MTEQMMFRNAKVVLSPVSREVIQVRPYTLTSHVKQYEKDKGIFLVPLLFDKNGFGRYFDEDFDFIVSLVLAQRFNIRRIAMMFSLNLENFTKLLKDKFSYNEDLENCYDYNDIVHDMKPLMINLVGD